MDSRAHGEPQDGWLQGPPRSGRVTSSLQRLMALRLITRRWDGRRRAGLAAGPSCPVADGGLPGPPSLGSMVLQARHESRLTRKQLAERLELSLWMIERLERDEVDASPYLASIAGATGRTEAWFAGAARRPGRSEALLADGAPEDGPSPRTAITAPVVMVLGALILLVVIRVFTELVPVLPRAANFVDIPILFGLTLAALLRPGPQLESRRVAFAISVGYLFVVVCAVATMTNLSRVDLAPALIFLYGLVGPVAIYFAVHRMWPPGSAKSVSQLLVVLGLLQLVVVFFVNLPEYIATKNPDVISGTFGENPYQMVFFLLVLAGLIAGIFTFEKKRAIARVVPVMLLAIMAAIFLAQYRSLLLTTALTILLVTGVLGLARFRGALAGAVCVATLLVTLAYVAQNVPALKFGSTIAQARDDPTLYFKKRVSTAGVLGTLFGDQPRFAITGTGPGTYSSRAWRTFAETTESDSDVAGDYVAALTNGRPYQTDVSTRYVIPQIRSEIIDGSRAVTTPFSSYLSISAETGMVGLALIVTLYLWAFGGSLRMTLASVRAARDGDSLPGLLCASTVAFFVLLQMAMLENWLEVTRITFFSWILFAIATKEFESREART
ncbi:MAG: hypothetical protein QOI64_1609 [Solirubrobacteraceae bacterium]|nr:hypothetical protein [Solirubrobacteraceae bacterium]